MDKTDIFISLRRTVVPIIVGSIMATWLGPNLETESLTAVVSGTVTSAYYLFWRVVETYVPGAGFFLGARKIPVYLDNAA